jgi:hypothetical protein
LSLIARYRALIRKPVTVRMLGEIADDPDGVWAEDELIRQIVEIADDHYKGAVEELEALREAVRAYLVGAPLDEHGHFTHPAREALYRAAGGQ